MNNKYKFVFILCLSLFMITSVYALGITPARTTINFKPGLQQTVGFEIINSNGDDVKLSLAVDGELANYMKLDTNEVFVSASESSKELSYEINLPNTLEPGLRTGRLIISEIPEENEGGESYVSATLGVAIQLHVNVPYPGKYATSTFVVYNAAPGEETTFVFPIVNKGEFDLTSVRANVDIYNKVGEKVDSFNTASISILSEEKKEIVHKWKADVPIGDYRAVATVIYDEGTINLESVFSIGSKELELQEISVNNFRLGGIAKLEMLVENKWSEQISDAYVETKIINEAKDVVASFKSATYSLEPLTKQVFDSYWDTAGVKIGSYQSDISIYYGDKTSKKSLEFQVEDDKLTVVGLGYVVSSGSSNGGSNNLVVILVVVIVLLVLVNLLWFFWIRKRLKK